VPELPDVTVYVERLNALCAGRPLWVLRILNPFVLRSVGIEPAALSGKRLRTASRLGKRVVLAFDEELYVVVHLMIAGRLRWRAPEQKVSRTIALGCFEFEHGRLWLTEAGKTRRASLHILHGADALREHDRGGLEPLDASRAAFLERLRMENHTLKRTLTDPRLFSGIGNAYSDEILHRARLSPMQQSRKLTEEEAERLHVATVQVLTEWIERLRAQVGEGFPEEVTAFRPEMAVHGRYGEPCPACGAAVQRIRYASNETNYCARCQTGGRLLADRALSRLLREDWPRSIDELE
jgi:formamidopyrimidine-DNA glycosylase